MSDEEMPQLMAASGADFDRMFAHDDRTSCRAIQVAGVEDANGANPEAKALAGQIMKAQYAQTSKRYRRIPGRL